MSEAKRTQWPWAAGPVFQKQGRAIFWTDTSKPGKWQRRVDDGSGVFSEEDARLIAAAPELLEALQEALRIEQARLVLADGLDERGEPYTAAQKLDAKAFLSKRRTNWLHGSIAVIAKATGSAA